MSWPEETAYERYPSDLTDEEWEIVKPILEKLDPYTTGRPRQVDLREVINAIFGSVPDMDFIPKPQIHIG